MSEAGGKTGTRGRHRVELPGGRSPQPSLPDGLCVFELDIDLRGDAPLDQEVSQPHGVLADRIATVQHGNELVHPAHRARNPPTP